MVTSNAHVKFSSPVGSSSLVIARNYARFMFYKLNMACKIGKKTSQCKIYIQL